MTTSGPASRIISAARFVLSFDNVEVTFSELTGISSQVEPAQAVSAGPAGTPVRTKSFGTASPPAVTLARHVDGSTTELWAWHTAVLEGNPAARKNCALKLLDAGGQTLLTFVLENAWLSKVDIAGLQAGASQVMMETDEFVCDSIRMQPG
jgi:phage tail-like protein